ncbi:5'-nucleotidase C-terminal domain-containing protein [Myxococcus sp. K15C18031901]|uniref:bifunctional metallophosphatase/5'-nucleotidase n=1 Tax=Myxococcus dinghuensis TaxID=2906761 RepID=UPI0020A7B3AA|nr:5'-nucleotidase C-terminal domain-containing protein [Myxococcus dinghuensis]MCP3098690.1 5'-nucleotidase C-terminal domain-containing protein [Myxococcus dinghuensis]
MPSTTRPFRLGLLSALLAACASHPPVPEAASAAPPAASPSEAKPAPQPLRITVVGTNDLHGWVTPSRATLPDGTGVEQGGLATLAGYLGILRAENPDGVLLLDGGDLFQGTLASNLTEGAVVIDAMNTLGYVASALGNHEFDYGPVGPRSVALEGDDPFGALKARIAQARFPILGFNVTDSQTGAIPTWLGNEGTLLVERQGVRIGVVGLATPHTPQVTNPVNVASLRFSELAPATLAAAQGLRARGAEVVVAVAHAGAVCKRQDDPRDASSCDRGDSEIIELLEALPEGTLDAVVAGHTHQPVGHFIRGTPVIETSGRGRAFGLVELFVDPVTRKVLPEQTRLQGSIPVCAKVDATLGTCDERALKGARQLSLVPATFRGQTVVTDAALEAQLTEAFARVEQEQRRSLGVQVPATLTRDYDAESPLGNVLADALREVSRTDIALLNSGGLRAELPAGELTYGAIYEVLPFDNTLAVLTVSATELKRLLEVAYARKGTFQVSGLKVKVETCNGVSKLVSVTLPNGKALPANKRFRVSMPDFLARGGGGLEDGLKALPAGSIDLGEKQALTLRDALVEHWKTRGKPLVAPTPGRILRVAGSAHCASEPSGKR